MFKKMLIANRGEIAVRVIQTCREMGIATAALYAPQEARSLHVAYADEAIPFSGSFSDPAAILAAAQACGADAIHPGYGFLAEESDFIRVCTAAGIAFIGPSADLLDRVHDKVETLAFVRANGFRTVESLRPAFDEDAESIAESAAQLGYPVVVKSCYGGRGPGERLARDPERLREAVRSALAESRAVFGKEAIYLEKAILPANQVGVQILADRHGNLIHLGDREGSLQHNNGKLIEEAPAPCLSPEGRAELLDSALALARLLGLENAATLEFLIDDAGRFYFTEVKARIQTEHALTEMITGVDLVREQIRIAAGDPLSLRQAEVRFRGHAVMCRIHAQDPLNRMRSSPGQLQEVRLPVGAGLRVDTYVQSGCNVPGTYASLVAKLTAWGGSREQAVARLGRALEDLTLTGVPTNIPFLQSLLRDEAFAVGRYSIETGYRHHAGIPEDDAYLQAVAVAAALLYAGRGQPAGAVVPDRLQSGWHRSSRRLPQ